jgi:nucleotide-binding universal stress UspA family protein
MKIVLATDGSECSEGAARFLTRFSFTPRDEIIVLHVITEIPYDDDYHAQIRQLIKKVAPKILKSSVNILKPLKAKISVMEEEGSPDATIIQIAVDSGADLIVMGARGLKGIKSVFIGSVTRAVAINSPKPVLITKPYPWEISGKMKVLFATDGSPSAHATAGLIASLPFPADTGIMIMHAAWSAASDLPERFVMELGDTIKEDIARARAIEFKKAEEIIHQDRTYLGERFRGVNTVIKGGDPSAEILREAETLKADLIAVGSRGLKGIKGMLGSVSRRILGHSHGPVLIGKIGEPPLPQG